MRNRLVAADFFPAHARTKRNTPAPARTTYRVAAFHPVKNDVTAASDVRRTVRRGGNDSMRRKSSVQRAIVVGAVALAAALSAPAAASAPATSAPAASAPAAAGDSTSQSDQVQAATVSAVDHAAGAATALAEKPGYAGVAVDYDAAKVTVSWKGDAPASVSALETKVPDGVTVDVERTPLSEADLHAASTRLLDSQRAAHGPDAVVAAFPAEDYASLVVEVSRDSALAREAGSTVASETGASKTGASETAAARTTSLAQSLEEEAGVPVRVELVDDGVQPTAASRRNDAAPWTAGGAMATTSGSDYCTTGFSIVTAAGNHKIVSAAHCNAGVGSLVRDGIGQRLGTVANRAAGIDAELIDPVGNPETAGAVFGGPWNASSVNSRYRFPVAAVHQPAVGQNICSSGAVTGEHCGAKIRATDVAWTCGNRTCHGFRASRDDGGVVVGGGDSGGPMYIVINGQAYARGMIDGGSNRRSCGSTSVPTQCFSYVYGIPMVDILNHWNARIDN
ncbi:hypothetical protein C8K30_101294 [Promicromonospora sp. AC04]|nr:hypothetical protein C8K30_101294 [Promicromonospora sp. AC04]